jgi:hypothetical protein
MICRGNGNPELPLMDLLGCVKAMLYEKDAALKALAQDNRERAERMQALQCQVGSSRDCAYAQRCKPCAVTAAQGWGLSLPTCLSAKRMHMPAADGEKRTWPCSAGGAAVGPGRGCR